MTVLAVSKIQVTRRSKNTKRDGM